MSEETSPHTPPGEVHPDGDHATLRFVRHLPHPPPKVWEALTDPEQLQSWFVQARALEGHVGGRVDMVGGPSAMHWTGQVLVWEPERALEYEWNLAPMEQAPKGERTRVRWELRPEGSGTALTLTHRRLTFPTAVGFAPGTHAFLDRLEHFLAGRPLPVWMKRYGEVAWMYPKWQGSGATHAQEVEVLGAGSGTLEEAGGMARLRFERLLPFPITRVWEALTAQEQLKGWFPADVQGERAEGAPLVFVFMADEGPPTAGEMKIYQPPHTLEFVWEGDTLRFELSPWGEGTRLVFTSTFPDRSVSARDAGGWHLCLDALDGVLAGEGGRPPRERWTQLHPAYLRRFGMALPS